MADTSQLSSTNLEMNVTAISEACDEYCKNVNDANIDVSKIASCFSPLTENGIAVNLIQSVSNAITQLTAMINDSVKMISKSLQQQLDTDQNTSNSWNSYGTNSGGGGNRNNNNNNNNNNNSSNPVTTDDTEVVKETTPLEVEDDLVPAVVEFEDVEKTKLIDFFDSILKDNINYLFDTNYASRIKELLLESPNLSEDLKQRIAQMDENELQVFLKEMYTSGETISDFSRAIITIFDSDLKENFTNATAIDSVDSISKVYSYITKQSNFQDEIKKLYFGSSTIKEVDDSVIFFTRSFIDAIATSSNVTYEDVLNGDSFKTTILEGAKELASSYEVLKNVKELDKNSLDSLYSSLLIRGK